MELFEAVRPFELLFLAYVIIYGIPFGFRNIVLRFSTFFTGKIVDQNDVGKLGDGAFVFSFIVLIVLNLK